ncbi:hypothetical protein [Helicobacter canadensis]|uniref:Uncharacterized protein n=1 Tax=Helicobacter canadensis MIT 98-5491 TaxID=537970 RepID=C5ZYL8_9HELI|nr:hypothetical protein [Helicobacter canadensis]EES90236.1 hypothetical protein HCAN_1531 [Helicobacter canadensis MIT 98-5491]EFR49006.1 hypothetical protein HCMG_01179 [Helicobacter canadensis MIT 98-5491]STO99961.1 Uncharacterised protein [Helicobacter canadensis]
MKQVLVVFCLGVFAWCYDPFFYEELDFRLLGVMPNKVNLNGKWLRLGEEFESFVVSEIGKKCVVLKNKKREDLREVCLVKERKFL